MKHQHSLIPLAKRIASALPVSEIVICKLEQHEHQLATRLFPETDNTVVLDSPIEFTKQEHTGCYFSPLDMVPSQLQALFTNCVHLIIAPVLYQPRVTRLLIAFKAKSDLDACSESLFKNLVDVLIDNDRLKMTNDSKERKYQDYIREVKTIKEKLLPAHDHRIEGLDYATYYRPSIGGGGDYFDLMDLREARKRAGVEDPPLIWGVGLMDVSGHGPGAAVEVAMVDAILRTYQGKIGAGPAEVIEYVNNHYFTRQSRGGFSTALLCNYDASTDVFSYASAGHLPLLIKHHEGPVTVLQSDTGIPIGIEREYKWTTESIQLEQGDTIIMYTDGIIEAESISGEHFGFDRLRSVLEQSPAGSAEVLMSNFMDNYHQHISNATEQDDQTLIMVTISS